MFVFLLVMPKSVPSPPRSKDKGSSRMSSSRSSSSPPRSGRSQSSTVRPSTSTRSSASAPSDLDDGVGLDPSPRLASVRRGNNLVVSTSLFQRPAPVATLASVSPPPPPPVPSSLAGSLASALSSGVVQSAGGAPVMATGVTSSSAAVADVVSAGAPSSLGLGFSRPPHPVNPQGWWPYAPWLQAQLPSAPMMAWTQSGSFPRVPGFSSSAWPAPMPPWVQQAPSSHPEVSTEDDVSCDMQEEEADLESSVPMPLSSSARGAALLDVLSRFSTALVAASRDFQSQSFTAQALGHRSSRVPEFEQVQESALIRERFRDINAYLASSSWEHPTSDGCVADEQVRTTPLASGKFVPVVSVPLVSGNVKWASSALPGKATPVTLSDQAIFEGKLKKTDRAPLTIDDVEGLERLSVRTLTALSALDTLLSTTVNVLENADPASEAAQFYVADDCDLEAAELCFDVMLDVIRAAVHDASSIFANLVLVRRDAALQLSSHPDSVRRSLRSLPLAASSLFGRTASSVLRQSAEQQRDRVILASASAAARQVPRRPSRGFRDYRRSAGGRQQQRPPPSETASRPASRGARSQSRGVRRPRQLDRRLPVPPQGGRGQTFQ